METTVNVEDPYGPPPPSEDPRPLSRRIVEATLVLNARRRFRLLSPTLSRRSSLNHEGLSRNSSSQFGSGRKTYIAPGKFAYRLLRKVRDKNAPEVTAARNEGFPDMDALYLAKLMEDKNLDQLAFLGDANGVCRSLKVEKMVGVQEDDIERRRRAFGSNAPERKVMRGFWSFVWDAMHDFTLFILAICALVSVILGLTAGGSNSEGWSDGLGIAFSIVLVVMVTSLSDYKQSLKFANLEREKEKVFVDVVRGGKRKKVLSAELVVGDIVLLGVGDQVPADGLLLVSNKLVVDESSLTGESQPSRKDARQKPYVFSGTLVMEGTGTMLVAAVGMNTVWGGAMSLVDTTICEQTPLQEELDRLVTKIGQIGASVAVLVLVISVVRYVWWKQPLGFWQWGSEQWLDVLQIFAVSVTIVVVAVPEGLPLAVTLTLAYSMDRMIQDRALVRHLSACETMGSATTICSDKTGTLTSNKMTVVDAWMCGSSCGNVQACVQNLSAATKDLTIEGIAFNTSGDVIMPAESDAPPSSCTVIGSPTEAAILSFGLDINGRFSELKKKHKLLAVEPFSSEKKKMGAAVKSTRGDVCVHWKGASEIVLQMCDSLRMLDDSVIRLDDALRRQIKDVISRMTERSLRTIGLAYKNIDPRGCPWDLQQAEDMAWKLPQDDLTFLGVLGLQDPPRPGVAKAVETCEKAGIAVRMVTGDNLGTARAVAKQCGIWKPGDLCVEGPVFRKWSDDQKRAFAGDIKVGETHFYYCNLF
ncbi:hypothetical protein CBR_g4773 [Chara braunii]|uniref:Calcium-transporting ATPase n=1 Tax=Chara braunii TaxID=69332 RepID=A0A388KIT5_CHABU|nr:hypothetical protein CBR_g4773 [Chara braunii]|eukprot:GBG69946.1 hypothetical protein CBR_g4773 [Chara braunii]